MALHEQGIDAVSLTGSQAGIITNDRHNDAQVIEVRPFRVQDEMANGKVVIIGGFQGVSYKRDITTLGRGGSDTTAVALAAALNADRCEIYSDVDGVYSADPAVVADARHLPEVSFPVMQEMSTAGAKVLHASAVQFAKEKNIAIYARATFSPGRETIVRQLSPGAVVGVQAVVSEKQVERVRLQAADIHGCFKNTVDYLEKNQISIKEVNFIDTTAAGEQTSASFIVSTKDIYGWERIKSVLLNDLKEKIVFDTNLAALSLIGEGLNRNNLTLLETLGLLGDNRITVLGMATTAFRISLLVSADQIEKSVELCHTRWVDNSGG